MTGEYAPEVVADLERMVAQGLALWGLPPHTTIRLLNLSENATFAVGGDLVLRVHRVGYSSAAEIRSELQWIEALRRDSVVDTAAPLRGRNGDWVQTLDSPSGRPSRHAVAFERLPGREPAAGADAAPWFERLGEVTARMHLHAQSWPRPAGFSRKRWDVDAMVGPRGFWGPWQAGAGLDAPGIAAIEDALLTIRRRLARFGESPSRFGLVHADLRLANLLVDGSHLRIIDFDDCGFSWFVYDFASAVSFIEHEPHLPVLLQAWIAGYRRAAPLPAEDAAEIPTFVMLRRIMLTAWLASHAEVPFARAIGAAYTAGTVALARDYQNGRFPADPHD
jgi:Ser/Thr protein kinase RdoA (MazF antagonist)